jgi:hypothetical protein
MRRRENQLLLIDAGELRKELERSRERSEAKRHRYADAAAIVRAAIMLREVTESSAEAFFGELMRLDTGELGERRATYEARAGIRRQCR